MACCTTEALWQECLHQADVSALYLHIPFCVRKCAYCDFSSWATNPHDPLMANYVNALERLLAEVEGVGLLRGCKTAYIGGGTPTFVGASLAQLVRDVRAAAPRVRELSCEANPDSLSDELLEQLKDAGCTRLSVGVQSLNDPELAELGRVHSALQAQTRLRAAVAAGFDVSADLMCAIPLQTDESWMASLAGVLACGVGHVSVYPLQIEDETPLGERYGASEPAFNDPEVQARRMELAREQLMKAGFERYEVASYARADKDCKHNQAYWTARPYLGLGTGASSMLTREGYVALQSICPQLTELSDGVSRVRLTCIDGRHELAVVRSMADLHFDLEFLSEVQAAAEDLMLGMRLVRGPEPGLVNHARKVIDGSAVDETLVWCESQGLIRENGQRWSPTNKGWLLGNILYGKMWDLAS